VLESVDEVVVVVVVVGALYSGALVVVVVVGCPFPALGGLEFLESPVAFEQ
jgi:hypothetical protein